jgi:hypothetical protein
VVNDPFGELPYDILHILLSLLPGKSVRGLMKASWPVTRVTRSTKFWKWLLFSDLPWFWELHELIKEFPDDANLDFKKLYLWADEFTTPTFGMRGRFLGIANRRRIWGPCQELAESYSRRCSEQKYKDSPS